MLTQNLLVDYYVLSQTVEKLSSYEYCKFK